MEPVSVKFGTSTMTITSLEQIETLRNAGKISEADAKNAKALFEAKNSPSGDSLDISNQEATVEDQAKAEESRTAHQQAVDREANNKYCGESFAKLSSNEHAQARDLLMKMTNEINHGNKESAALFYDQLDDLGVFRQAVIDQPPYAQALKAIAAK